jgi:hypothetical protein
MPQFKNLNELFAKIQSAISDSLLHEVTDVTRETMREQIYSTVYAVYEPTQYVRKMDEGGLSDYHNISASLIDDNTLEIRNIRDDHNGMRDVARVVETGVGYHYVTNSVLTDGRPFTENTVEELKSSKAHVEAMKQGLIRNGFDVR